MKLTRYQATYNPILEYWQAIQDGREVVSLKVQKTYRHVVEQLGAENSEFYDTVQDWLTDVVRGYISKGDRE